MTKTYNFKGANEVTLSDYIAEFAKQTEIDGIVLSKILYSKTRQGKKYLLENGDAETRMEIVKSMVNDNSINFAMMRLTRFPDEILAFPNLKKLSLRTGKFKSIPEGLSKLSELEVLDLGATSNVKEFPETILKLKNLKYLSLSYTKYGLPESLKTLEKLECLELLNRDMKTLPEWLSELPSLQYLNIQGNPFDELPGVLYKMTSLKELTNDFFIYKKPEEDKLKKALPKTRFSFVENMIDKYFKIKN